MWLLAPALLFCSSAFDIPSFSATCCLDLALTRPHSSADTSTTTTTTLYTILCGSLLRLHDTDDPNDSIRHGGQKRIRSHYLFSSFTHCITTRCHGQSRVDGSSAADSSFCALGKRNGQSFLFTYSQASDGRVLVIVHQPRGNTTVLHGRDAGQRGRRRGEGCLRVAGRGLFPLFFSFVPFTTERCPGLGR